jgi:hypothetical protein
VGLILNRVLKDLIKAFLGKAFLNSTLALGPTRRKGSAPLRNGRRERVLLFVLRIIFGFS